MFSSGFIHILHNLSPIFSLIFGNELEDYEVFFTSPRSLFYVFIEVVLPSFPALFGSLEEFSIGLPVKLFSDFIPLSELEIASYERGYRKTFRSS